MNWEQTALEIVREAILQGLSIATTVASELRGFGLDDVEREWALEFTLAKSAVLSVRAERLTDDALKTALVREIELFVSRRATLDPTIPFGFQSYGRIVRENDVPSVEFVHAIGSLFRQRLNKTLLALPTSGMIRPTDNERLVSSSIAADHCWPLKNPTEASVFGPPMEKEPSPESEVAARAAFMAATKRAWEELPRRLGRQPTFDEVTERADEIMVEAGYKSRHGS